MIPSASELTWISLAFGPQESYHAIDLRCANHTPVLSMGDGIVKEIAESHKCLGCLGLTVLKQLAFLPFFLQVDLSINLLASIGLLFMIR